jgi:2-haloacid dehalogenase
LDFAAFEAISFDCYGTLIDWEAGILAALRPILARHGVRCADDEILRRYAIAEPRLQSSDYRPYRDVLRGVVQSLADELGFSVSEAERDCLAHSLPEWPPFFDTVPALMALRRRYRLVVVSNIDEDLFTATARRLEVTFDEVVTAQQVKSYKPALRHFEAMLQRLRLPPEQVLHVAGSLYHDIVPTRRMGIPNVWVQRNRDRRAHDASVQVDVSPDLAVPDLQTLVGIMKLG